MRQRGTLNASGNLDFMLPIAIKSWEPCHAFVMKGRVGTSKLDFYNFPSKKILLSCTSELVSVDEQASTVRLIYFTT